MFRRVVLVIGMGLFLSASARAEAFVFINEVLADPPTGLAGDSNNDGVRSYKDDEFVELFNAGAAGVDLSGWTLSDSAAVRHIFLPGTFLPSLNYLVVFGGGAPALPGIAWQTASSGSLELNNDGDAVTLLDATSAIVDALIYGTEGGQDQSLARFPEGTGPFVPHTSIPLANGALFSPGTGFSSQSSVPGTTPVPTPEPFSVFLLGLGVTSSFWIKRGC